MILMSVAARLLPLASCCRHDGAMPDWDRLAAHVVSRRVELGYRTRQQFAQASTGLSVRTLGDVETARRASYDKGTIAALEQALGWVTGSVNTVLDGGDATPRAETPPDLPEADPADRALARVMKSDLPEAKKRLIVKMLLEERREAERRWLDRAGQLIDLARDD